ncbi:hypothetical protein SteCoe_10362 [Stentor coeruleus]|uniref:Uncharacterized protein n=1 Tax=Stentor coeruleus TaxID=5963 RepID=A0A1R2CFZ0_9CILI|nr:hypothetical protein SteCoe_10362 [Stentor coeruleus]
MALILDLSDDIFLNIVLMFIGDVKDFLEIRSVSKAFNEKVELLLPAIVELDLTALEILNQDPIYSEHKNELEDFEDLKKMQQFRLKRLKFCKELDAFDLCIGQGLAYLAYNSGQELNIEDIENLYYLSLQYDLQKVLECQCNEENAKKAEEECIKALAIRIEVNEQQRKMLNWLTGALKMHQMFKKFSEHYEYLSRIQRKVTYFNTRVTQISKFFGYFY